MAVRCIINSSNEKLVLQKIKRVADNARAALQQTIGEMIHEIYETERQLAPPPTTVDRVRDKVLTRHEAASYVGCSKETIGRWVKSGHIREIREGRQKFVIVHADMRANSARTRNGVTRNETLRSGEERSVHIKVPQYRTSSGYMRSRIRKYVGKLRGSVNVLCPYAKYVETGTGGRGAHDGNTNKRPDVSYTPGWPGMKAQPFIWPAYKQAKKHYRKRFIENLKRRTL